MPIMTWNETLELGIPSIDGQHKKLVALLNDLFDGMKAAKGREMVGRILDELIAYTSEHFQYEEKLFAKANYPASVSHKTEHAELVKKVLALQERYKKFPNSSMSLEVLNFLKEWLSNHIQGTDKKYVPYMLSQGIA